MSDNEKPKPLLLTVGSIGQSSLWKPLSEHFRLVFSDQGAHQLALGMGVQCALIGQVIDRELLLLATYSGMQVADELIGGIAEGRFAGLDETTMPALGPVAMELTSSVALRYMACQRIAQTEGGFAGLLLHEDVTEASRSFIEFARNHGVPVFHLPHANHFLEPGTADVHSSISSDWIGVRGSYMAAWYLACGADPDRLAFIGAPELDKYYLPDVLPQKEHSRRCLGLSPEKPVFALATTWAQDTGVWGKGHEDTLWAIRRFLEACNALSGQAVIKAHPGEPAEHLQNYANIMAAYGQAGVVTAEHAEHVLVASDVLVTYGPSNIAVLAQIAGCPVVELMEPSAKYPKDYGFPSTWGEDLEACIQGAVATPRNERFLLDMNHAGDGRAGKRAVAWILQKTGVV